MGRKPSETVAERRRIVRHKLLVECKKSRDIAREMLAEGTLTAASDEKAERLVRGDVEHITRNLTPGDAQTSRRANELLADRCAHVMAFAIRQLEKLETVSVSKVTFNDGREMTVVRKSDRSGVCERYLSAYLRAARLSALASGGLAKAPQDDENDREAISDAQGAEPAKPFVIRTSGKSLNELTEENAEGQVPN